ncbi:MAG: hypothetical protein QW105_02190 [Nitrososphaerota archaeon]
MVEYTWQGRIYTRPDTEPPQIRDSDALHPVFGAPLAAYLEQANKVLTHVLIRPSETIRSVERQAWLFAQGRDPTMIAQGFRRQVTWTLDSMHLYGLAADLVMIRRSNNQAIWETTSWQWLYRVVPPTDFGLTSLAPTEWVHLEHICAKELIKKGIYSRGR